ncbi:MAG: methyl-accepting chemotaxis protein, partial [Vicinamibacteria bacterium]
MATAGVVKGSIRTRLLLLVSLVALVVGGVSSLSGLRSGQGVLREELRKRGRYIAANLAYNSKYGVLTEDKPLLNQLLEGAMSSVGGTQSDVVGAMIRDAKGSILAQKGVAIRDLPAAPAATAIEIDAQSDHGDDVFLFRAPVMTAGSSGGSMAAELGLASPSGAAAEEQKGGVEVVLSKAAMVSQQRSLFIQTTLVGLALIGLGAVAGWYLIGLWFRPVQTMVEVASAVAKGDLTERIKIESTDEMGTLAGSLNEMVDNLRRVVDNIQETSVQVATAAGQISANAKLITEGAQSQAQAAEETSTSMEEMAASIQTVAGNAQSLATYVEET